MAAVVYPDQALAGQAAAPHLLIECPTAKAHACALSVRHEVASHCIPRRPLLLSYVATPKFEFRSRIVAEYVWGLRFGAAGNKQIRFSNQRNIGSPLEVLHLRFPSPGKPVAACWRLTVNSGFTTGRPWLSIDQSCRSVETEFQDKYSLLHLFKSLVALRSVEPG